MSQTDQEDASHYVLPLNQPVVSLDCVEAFNGLTEKEKLYAHFLSQAAWYGGTVVTAQTSPESPGIFAVLLDLFKSNGLNGLKEIALGRCKFTEDDWKVFPTVQKTCCRYAL
jgi:dipeptidyl-peptidase-3